MKITVQSLPQHRATLLALREESLVAANSQSFSTALAPYLASGDTLLIDLAELKFIDSSGLGCLLAGLRGINKHGGQLCLIRPSKAVRAIFELQRLHKLFTLADSLEEALATRRP